MNWTSLPNRTCGISFSETHLHALILVRRHHKVQLKQHVSIALEGREPLDALTELKSKLKKITYVWALLPTHEANVILIPDELPLDTAISQDWASGMLDTLIPDYHSENTIIRHIRLRGKEDQRNILIMSVPDTVLESYEKLFLKAGFQVLYWGGGWLELGNAFVLDKEFVSKPNYIIWQAEEKTFLLGYNFGQLTSLHMIGASHTPYHILMEEVELQQQTWDRQNDATDATSQQNTYTLVSNNEIDWEVAHEHPEITLKIGNPVLNPPTKLDSPFAPAVALAIQGLFSDLPKLNLLDSSVSHQRLDACLKDYTLKWILKWGVGFLIVYMLFTLLNVSLAQFLYSRDPQMAIATKNLAEREKLRIKMDSLQSVFLHWNSVKAAQPYKSKTLFLLTQTLPDHIWLQEIKADSIGGLGIKGFTNDHESLSFYAADLQKQGIVLQVKTIQATRLDSMSLEKMGLPTRLALSRFELNAQLRK